MKTLFSLTLLLFLAHIGDAQTRAIAKSDHDAVFGNAVRTSNAAFPFVFTVTTETYENGKVVTTETHITERQAAGVERETKSLIKGGQTLRSYSVMVGFGTNTFCSTDGITWTGPQGFVCPGPDGSGLVRLYRPRSPESVEYTGLESVCQKSVCGRKS